MTEPVLKNRRLGAVLIGIGVGLALGAATSSWLIGVVAAFVASTAFWVAGSRASRS